MMIDIRKKFIVKVTAVLVVAAFLHQDIVMAQGGPVTSAQRSGQVTIPQTQNAVDVASVVPSKLGEVTGSFDGGQDLRVFAIQDSHASIGAQESISGIIGTLVDKYDLKVVAVEASSGRIDTSLLRTIPDKEIRRSTAEYLMETGRLSGAELYAVTAENDIAIYGAEDIEAYSDNLKEFRDVYKDKDKVLAALGRVRAVIDAVKDEVYSDALKELDAVSSRDDEKELSSLGSKLTRLKDLAFSAGVDLGLFPAICRVSDCLDLEKDIDFKKAQIERDRMISLLSTRASKEDLESLAKKTLSLKKGDITPAEYHLFLVSMATGSGIQLENFPNVAAYAEYLSRFESVDVTALFEELSRAEGPIWEKLLKNDDQRLLHSYSDLLAGLECLFDARMTCSDLEKLKKLLAAVSPEDIEKFTSGRKLNGEPASIGADLKTVFDRVPLAARFYQTAEKRNSALVANTIRRMRENGRTAAALVTGGFHTKGMTDILRSSGTSYVIIIPKCSSERGERPYVAILTNKTASYRGLLESGRCQIAVSSFFAERGAFDEGAVTAFIEEFVAAAIAQTAMKSGKDAAVSEKGKWLQAYVAAKSEARGEGIVSEERFKEILDSLTVRSRGDHEAEISYKGEDGTRLLRFAAKDGRIRLERVKETAVKAVEAPVATAQQGPALTRGASSFDEARIDEIGSRTAQRLSSRGVGIDGFDEILPSVLKSVGIAPSTVDAQVAERIRQIASERVSIGREEPIKVEPAGEPEAFLTPKTSSAPPIITGQTASLTTPSVIITTEKEKPAATAGSLLANPIFLAPAILFLISWKGQLDVSIAAGVAALGSVLVLAVIVKSMPRNIDTILSWVVFSDFLMMVGGFIGIRHYYAIDMLPLYTAGFAIPAAVSLYIVFLTRKHPKMRHEDHELKTNCSVGIFAIAQYLLFIAVSCPLMLGYFIALPGSFILSVIAVNIFTENKRFKIMGLIAPLLGNLFLYLLLTFIEPYNLPTEKLADSVHEVAREDWGSKQWIELHGWELSQAQEREIKLRLGLLSSRSDSKVAENKIIELLLSVSEEGYLKADSMIIDILRQGYFASQRVTDHLAVVDRFHEKYQAYGKKRSNEVDFFLSKREAFISVYANVLTHSAFLYEEILPLMLTKDPGVWEDVKKFVRAGRTTAVVKLVTKMTDDCWKGTDVVPNLIGLYREGDKLAPEVRAAAVMTVAKLSGSHTGEVKILQKLKGVKPPDASIRAFLDTAFRDPALVVRRAAAEALLEFGNTSDEVLRQAVLGAMTHGGFSGLTILEEVPSGSPNYSKHRFYGFMEKERTTAIVLESLKSGDKIMVKNAVAALSPLIDGSYYLYEGNKLERSGILAYGRDDILLELEKAAIASKDPDVKLAILKEFMFGARGSGRRSREFVAAAERVLRSDLETAPKMVDHIFNLIRCALNHSTDEDGRDPFWFQSSFPFGSEGTSPGVLCLLSYLAATDAGCAEAISKHIVDTDLEKHRDRSVDDVRSYLAVEALGASNQKATLDALLKAIKFPHIQVYDEIAAVIKNSRAGMRAGLVGKNPTVTDITEDDVKRAVLVLNSELKGKHPRDAAIALDDIKGEVLPQNRSLFFEILFLGGYEHGNSSVRYRIGHYGNAAVPFLKVMLLTKERDEAVDLLKTIGTPEALKAIEDNGKDASHNSHEGLLVLLGSENSSIRLRAAEELGKLNDPRAVGPLFDVIKKDTNERVESSAREALKTIVPSIKDVYLLVKLLELDDYGINSSVAEALGRIKDQKALRPLAEIMKKHQMGSYNAAARAIEAIVGSSTDVDALTELLRSDEGSIRDSAITSLGAVNTESSIFVLSGLLDDEKLRDKAQKALKANAKTKDLIEWLEKAYVDKDRAKIKTIEKILEAIDAGGLIKWRQARGETALKEMLPYLKWIGIALGGLLALFTAALAVFKMLKRRGSSLLLVLGLGLGLAPGLEAGEGYVVSASIAILKGQLDTLFYFGAFALGVAFAFLVLTKIKWLEPGFPKVFSMMLGHISLIFGFVGIRHFYSIEMLPYYSAALAISAVFWLNSFFVMKIFSRVYDYDEHVGMSLGFFVVAQYFLFISLICPPMLNYWDVAIAIAALMMVNDIGSEGKYTLLLVPLFSGVIMNLFAYSLLKFKEPYDKPTKDLAQELVHKYDEFRFANDWEWLPDARRSARVLSLREDFKVAENIIMDNIFLRNDRLVGILSEGDFASPRVMERIAILKYLSELSKDKSRTPGRLSAALSDDNMAFFLSKRDGLIDAYARMLPAIWHLDERDILLAMVKKDQSVWEDIKRYIFSRNDVLARRVLEDMANSDWDIYAVIARLSSIYKDSNKLSPEVRASLVLTMKRLAGRVSHVPEIVKMLDVSGPDLKEAALVFNSELKGDNALNAAIALDDLKGEVLPENRTRFFGLLFGDINAWSRIGNYGDAAVPFLKMMLSTEKRDTALKLLVEYIHTPEALNVAGSAAQNTYEYFVSMLKSEERLVRSSAAKGLGELKDIRAIEPLIAALKDEDRDVVVFAERGLAAIASSSKDADILMKMDAIGNDKVGCAVSEALSKVALSLTIDVDQLLGWYESSKPLTKNNLRIVLTHRINDLLDILEKAYAGKDREKINKLEKVLTEVAPDGLKQWKQERLKKDMPDLVPYLKWIGIAFGALLAVFTAGLAVYKMLKRRGSSLLLVLGLGFGLVPGLEAGEGGVTAGSIALTVSVLVVLGVISMNANEGRGTGGGSQQSAEGSKTGGEAPPALKSEEVDAILAEEMMKFHGLMVRDAKSRTLGANTEEMYEFTRRDRRKWADFINEFRDELGLAKAFFKGAKYVYGDRMRDAADEKIFYTNLRAIDAAKIASLDPKSPSTEELISEKLADSFAELLVTNPAALYAFTVRGYDDPSKSAASKVAGLLVSSRGEDRVKGVMTWLKLPDELAKYLITSAFASGDPEIASAAARVAGERGYKEFMPDLWRLYRSGVPSDAIAALEAISLLGARPEVDAIFKDLTTVGASDKNVQAAMIIAIARLGHPQAEETLTRSLRFFAGGNVPPEIVKAAVDAIVILGARERAIAAIEAARPSQSAGEKKDRESFMNMLKTASGLSRRPPPYVFDKDLESTALAAARDQAKVIDVFHRSLNEKLTSYAELSDRSSLFYRNGNSVQFMDTRIPILPESDDKQHSSPDESTTPIVPIQKTISDLEKIAQAVRMREGLLLVGETGVGKTTLIRYLARLARAKVRRFNLSGQTDKSEFIGGYKPKRLTLSSNEAVDIINGMLGDLNKNGTVLTKAVKAITGENMTLEIALAKIKAASDSRNMKFLINIAEAARDADMEFEWQYGILIDAMRRGDWVILDEINLAEPEIIERIRYLLDAHPHLELTEYKNEKWIDHRDYDRMVMEISAQIRSKNPTVKPEDMLKEAVDSLTAQGIFRIHHNFRLFATMNPADGEYEGRKALSPALLNKFRVKWVKELEPDDLRGIISSRYKFDPAVTEKVILFYAALKQMSGRGGILGRNEGTNYYYTIRHLMRLCDRLKGALPSGKSADAALSNAVLREEISEVFRDMLRTGEDTKEFDVLLNKIVPGTSSKREIKILRDKANRAVKIGSVTLEVNPVGGKLVPGASSKMLDVPPTMEKLEKLAKCIKNRERPLLVGGTGVAKTSLVRYLAHLTNNEYERVNMDGQTYTSDFVGREIPRAGGGFDWQNGVLLEAMEKGRWLLLDEFNLADADIMERLNSLFDDDGSFIVTENKHEEWIPHHIYDMRKQRGDDMSKYRRIHENFRIIAAMNPDRYAGRNRISRAMANKFSEKWIGDDFVEEDVHAIAKFFLTDTDIMEEGPLSPEFTEECAGIISSFYFNVRSKIRSGELGKDKISGATGEDYTFSLRDLKAWAKFIRRLSPDIGINKSMVEGALYIFRDRFEDPLDKVKFNNDLLKPMKQVKGGNSVSVDIDKLDVLEEEGRRPEELIKEFHIGKDQEKTLDEKRAVILAEIIDKFDVLTMSFDPELKDGLKLIRNLLSNPATATDGVRGFVLFPESAAKALVTMVISMDDTDMTIAAYEVIGQLGMKGFELRLLEAIKTGSDMRLKLTAALVLERSGFTFPADINGRPSSLPYLETMSKLLSKGQNEGKLGGDYLGAKKFLYRQFLFSLVILSIMFFVSAHISYAMPWYYPPVLSFVAINALSLTLALSTFVLYAAVYMPVYSVISKRYKTLPLSKDDFYALFEQPEEKNSFIRFPFVQAAKKDASVIASARPWIYGVAGLAGVLAGAVGAYIGLSSGYLSNAALMYPVAVLGGGILSVCASEVFMFFGNVASETIVFLQKYTYRGVKNIFVLLARKVTGLWSTAEIGSFDFILPKAYDKDMVDLFEKHRKGQAGAAGVANALTAKRKGYADLNGVIRDNKVIRDNDGLTIDDISIADRKGHNEDLIPNADDAKQVNVISTVRNMKKVAYSLLIDEPVLLVGESGVGKTSIVRYLASLTKWSHMRFNLNGQTEKTELIGGYRPDGQGGYNWTDGIIVKAMREGSILVLDEINLAESQVLERINSLLDDDRSLSIPENNTMWVNGKKYREMLKEAMRENNVNENEARALLTAQGKFMIAPDFRVVATMNPIDYAGRNILSPALMNRFKVKWVEEPYEAEIEAIFNERFKDKDAFPMLSWGMLNRIVVFHTRLKAIAGARVIGSDERDPYYYSVRDIMKTGGRIRSEIDRLEKATGAKLSAEDRDLIAVRELSEVYLDRIRDEHDASSVKDIVRQFFGRYSRVSAPGKISADDKTLKIGRAELPINKENGPEVRRDSSVLTHTPTTCLNLEKIARAIQFDERPLLVGPTGSAKTSLVRYLAHLTGNKFIRLNLDAHSDTSEIIGSNIPVEGKKNEFEWRDGLLLSALKNGWWILFDELNLADAEILERINPLLDDEGSIVVTEHENEVLMANKAYERKVREYIAERVKKSDMRDAATLRKEAIDDLARRKIFRIHENFRLIAAMNPERYAGRNRLSAAMRNKMNEIWISGQMAPEEYRQILADAIKGGPDKDKMIDLMVSLHLAMYEVAEHLEGGGMDKYQFSMRDIKALAKYINRYGPGLGWDRALSRGIVYLYLDRLTTSSDKEKFLDMLKDLSGSSLYKKAYDGVKRELQTAISPGERAAAGIRSSGKVKSLLAELSVNASPNAPELVPIIGPGDFVHTDSTLRDLEKVFQAVDLDEPLLLVGETGAGKTSLARYGAFLTNNGFLRVNLSGQTEKTELIGGYHPDGKGGFVWKDGALIEALKTGSWLVIDEINLAPSQVIERLNSLLDDDGSLVLSEHKGERFVKRSLYDEELSERANKIQKDTKCTREAAIQRAGEDMKNAGIFMINTNFRLIATMNPSEYAGRQAFSPALLNRFRVKWIDELKRSDVETIFTEKYSKTLGRDNVLKAVDVHYKAFAASKENKPFMGRYTIRHIARWMDRVKTGVAEGWDSDVKRLMMEEGLEVYCDGLADQGQEQDLRSEIEKYFTGAFQCAARAPDIAISKTADKVMFGKVSLKRKSAREHFVSGPNISETPEMKARLKKLAKAIHMNEKVLLTGLTGGGKSEIARYISDLANNNFMAFDLDGQTDVAQLIGQFVPAEGTDSFDWVDGALIKAMRTGSWILIDELNLADPEIIERINSLLDDDGSLTVNEHLSEKWVPAHVYDRIPEGKDKSKLRRIHPDFRIITAMNPEHYAGRTRMSEAMLNKFYHIWIPQEGSTEQEKVITAGYLGSAVNGNFPNMDIKGDKASPIREAIGRFSADSAERARRKPRGMYISFLGTGAFMMLWDIYKDWSDERKEKKLRALSDASKKPSRYFNQAQSEASNEGWFGRMRRGFRERSLNVRLKRVDLISKFYGNDFNMTARPGEGWAIDYSDPKQPTLIYSEKDLTEKGPEYVAAVTMHEAGHRDISFFHDFFFEKESRRYLLNAIEDPRVNNWTMVKAPGAKDDFDKLYDDTFPRKGHGGERSISNAMPHIQYGLGVIYHWLYGVDHPEIKDQKVLDALKKTRGAVGEAYNTLPGTTVLSSFGEDRMIISSVGSGKKIVDIPPAGQTYHYDREDIQSIERVNDKTIRVLTPRGVENVDIPVKGEVRRIITNISPSFDEKKNTSLEFSAIVRRDILPAYEELVKESIERSKQGQQGGQQGQQGGQQGEQGQQGSKGAGGGGAGGKSGKRSQAEAEDDVEKASKEFADKLAGKILDDKNKAGKDKDKGEGEGSSEGKEQGADKDDKDKGKGKGIGKDEKGDKDKAGKDKDKGEGEGSGEGKEEGVESGDKGGKDGKPKDEGRGTRDGKQGAGSGALGEEGDGVGGKATLRGDDFGGKLTVGDRMKLDAKIREILNVDRKDGIYDKYLRPVSGLIERLRGILENELMKDKKFRYKGFFSTGTKLHMRKAMTMRKTGDMDIWMRRVKPTKRSYKFEIILDESGSMGGGYSETSVDALKALVMAMETLSRLEIDFGVIGFSEAPSVHKKIEKPFKGMDKDALMSEIVDYMSRGGSTDDSAAVSMGTKELEKLTSDNKVMLVITDGGGNGSVHVRKVIREARKKGIVVIGVGIGQAMTYVKDVYNPHVLVDKMEDLPAALAKTLVDVIVKGKFPPVDYEEKQQEGLAMVRLPVFAMCLAAAFTAAAGGFTGAVMPLMLAALGFAAAETGFAGLAARSVRRVLKGSGRLGTGAEEKKTRVIVGLREGISAKEIGTLSDIPDAETAFVKDMNELEGISSRTGIPAVFIDIPGEEITANSENIRRQVEAIKNEAQTAELEGALTRITSALSRREELERLVLSLSGTLEAPAPVTEEQLRSAAEVLRTRRDRMKDALNSVNMPSAEELSEKTPIAAVTSETVLAADVYGADNTAAAPGNVKNCVIYGGMFKSEPELRRHMRAAGYSGIVIDATIFVDKRGKSYQEILDEISARTGAIVGRIGIRACASDGLLAPGAGTLGEKYLEIGCARSGKGEELPLAMNSYQVMLKLIAASNAKGLEGENAAMALKELGISFDAVRGIFIYLPRALPLDYDVEVIIYRRAIEVINSAA